MRSIARHALIIASVCLFFSCGQNEFAKDEGKQAVTLQTIQQERAEDKKINEYESITNADSADAPKGKQQSKQQDPSAKAPPAVKEDWNRKIIKTADMTVEVKDHQAFYSSLRQKVRDLGGYVANEEQKQDDYRIENSVVIKVPVAQFDEALSGLNTGIIAMTQKKVSSQDVTGEMVDTRSRLETKKRVRQRYTELLGHAKNVEEMFTVEKEINSIQEDIEAADGRLNYLGHSASYSTINLTYYQVLNPALKDKSTPGFGTQLKDAFGSGWQWLGGLVVGMIAVWPFLLLIILLYWVFQKKIIRRKAV